jgi:hypothetical protein
MPQPPHGELFDQVCDLCDAAPAVLPGLHALTLLSRVPDAPHLKKCLTVAEASEYVQQDDLCCFDVSTTHCPQVCV